MNNQDRFTIGGEVIFEPTDEADEADARREQQALDDLRVRMGTLLKTESVSLLLGAGASVACGGPLIGKVPVAVEQKLHEEGVSGGASPRVRNWLKIFYLAVRRAGGMATVPIARDAILERHESLRAYGAEPIAVNFERVLALMHRWRAAMNGGGGRLRLDSSPSVNVGSKDLEASLVHTTRALARTCDLPTEGKHGELSSFKTFVRKLLTRPLNLKRVNVFTLNYDTLVEQAADSEGVVLLDGFIGTQRRVFRPECYEQDLYFPAETTEGRVHRFDRVLHLYKLHGSITWTASEPTIDNPYGVESGPYDPQCSRALLIYPTPAKYGETLGLPYSELFRRFAGAIARPQSVLIIIGYGFGDEHVNTIIRQALAVPSFTLVIVDPSPRSEFVTSLRGQDDRRVWVAEGPILGKFKGFVDHLLPDLRDEEIRRKVLATHRALSQMERAPGDVSDGD